MAGLPVGPDLNGAAGVFRLRPDQVDMQQAIVEMGIGHFHTFREYKCPLELAGRNAAMQEHPLAVIDLTAANNQLIVFQHVRVGDLRELRGDLREGAAVAGLLRLLLPLRRARR